jgi:hypothetical protein
VLSDEARVYYFFRVVGGKKSLDWSEGQNAGKGKLNASGQEGQAQNEE